MKLLLDLYLGDVAALHVVTYLIQVTVTIGFGLAVAKVFRWHAAARHQLLMLTWVIILLLPVLSWLSHRSGLAAVWPLGEWMLNGSTAGLAENLGFVGFEGKAVADQSAADAASKASVSLFNPEVLRTMFSAFCIVWLLGWLRHTLRLFGSVRALRTLLKDSIAGSPDGPFEQIARSIARRLGLSQAPPIRFSRGNGSPAVVGFLRPVLLFPESLAAGLKEAQLRHVIMHEMAHVARRDNLMVLLQSVCAAIFWFHPGIRLLNRSLSQAREEVCDNHVLQDTEKAAYGFTLLEIAESLNKTGVLQPSVGLLGDTWSLEARVSELLNQRRNTMTKVRLQFSVFTGLATTALLTMLAIGHPVWGLGDGSQPLSEDSAMSSSDAAPGETQQASAKEQQSGQVGESEKGKMESQKSVDPSKVDAPRLQEMLVLLDAKRSELVKERKKILVALEKEERVLLQQQKELELVLLQRLKEEKKAKEKDSLNTN